MFWNKETTNTIDQDVLAELLQLATLTSVLKSETFTFNQNNQQSILKLTPQTIWTYSVTLLTQALRKGGFKQYYNLLHQALVNYQRENPPHNRVDLQAVKQVDQIFQSSPQQFDYYLDGMTKIAHDSLLKHSLPVHEQLLSLTNSELTNLYYNLNSALVLQLPHATIAIGDKILTSDARLCADAIQISTIINLLGFSKKTVFENLKANDISDNQQLSKIEYDFYQKYSK